MPAKEWVRSFLLHRHRVYNPAKRLWMGWERKRGKLMDLNNLLRGQFDSFPVKVGDFSLLPSMRYVITLDSDTELPRGSAQPHGGSAGASLESGDHRSREGHRRRWIRHFAAPGWS